MKARLLPWSVLLLVSALLSLAPSVLFHDLTGGAEAPEQRVEMEKRMFQALVVPSSGIAEIFGVDRTGFATAARGADVHELASTLALEHARAAVPFWFFLLTSAFELTRLARRRMREADERRLARFRFQS